MSQAKATATSHTASTKTSAASSINKPAICSMFDGHPDTKGVGISYVSAAQSVVLREPRSVVETRAIITPLRNEDRPDNAAMLKRLAEVGVDCLIAAPVTYFATAVACGSAPATFGVTAVPCIFATTGAVTTSLKCGHTIGKLVNHAIDPRNNELLDHNEKWKMYETGVDFVDLLANLHDAAVGVKNIGRLTRLTSKYGKYAFKRASIAESKVLFRGLAEELGESFTHQGTRRYFNTQGVTTRFTNDAVSGFLKSRLRTEIFNTGLAGANVYNDIASTNNRQNFSPALPKQDLFKQPLYDAIDSSKSAETPPEYSIIWIQQAKP